MGNISTKFNVALFGGLSITDQNGTILDETGLRSPMLVKLLVYLFSHRDRNMSSQELIDALWPDEAADNPIGALRNLIYRLRTVFKQIWGEEGKKFILAHEGTYSWNENLEMTLDVEQFEVFRNKAKDTYDMKERLGYLRQMLALYKGFYMQGYDDTSWIATTQIYYHSQYLSAAKTAAQMIEKAGAFAEMEALMRFALSLEMLDEELHVYFIRSLMQQGKYNLALDQYEKSLDLLYEELGISDPIKLRALYEELMKQNHEEELDINVIARDLSQDYYGDGALFCEYGVFKQIYQLEVRRAARMGISLYLSLIQIKLEIEGSRKDTKVQEQLADAMEYFRMSLLRTLRSGDVVTRYSKSQFILLLPTCEYDSAIKVMQRVERDFQKKEKSGKIHMRYSLGSLMEKEEKVYR